jgi:hypothetical protein
MDWIPIQEGHPIILTLRQEDGAKTVKMGYVDASGALHALSGEDVTGRVEAWMPLPEPYPG